MGNGRQEWAVQPIQYLIRIAIKQFLIKMELKKHTIAMAKMLSKVKNNIFLKIFLVWILCLTIGNLWGQEKIDPTEYIKKTIPLIANDSMDSLKLRSTAFTFVLEKTVEIKNISELIALFGKPCHVHYTDSGDVHLIYSLDYKDCTRPGSMLPIFLFDSNAEFLSCWIYFLETDEDFNYWYSSPPYESKGGGLLSPPTFRYK